MTAQRVRKPDWLRVSLPIGDEYERVKAKVNSLSLHTVCKEAACPNVAECWGAGTATIMILGDTCTRGCRFCNVKTGNPRGEVDWLEPLRVAEAVRDLGWKYLVVTAVDRDDLADGGALIFANTVRAIHERVPGARVEILSGDYRGDLRAVDIVVDAKPDVFAHNLETVRRLTPSVRDKRAGYDQSLAVLAHAKLRAPDRFTKTSLMLGLGERESEIETAMDDARARRRRHPHDGAVLAAEQETLAGGRVRYARAIRAPREARGKQGLSPGRFEPAFTQLVSRGTGLLAGLPVLRDGATTAISLRFVELDVTKVFLTRPVLAAVCSLIILIGGLVVMPTLPLAQYPQIAPPVVTISASYVGASPQAVEAQVTTPLEQAVNTVQGLRYISSSEHAGHLDDHLHLHARNGSRHRRGRRPELGPIGNRSAAGDGAASRRPGQQELGLLRDGHRPDVR